jgi:hypothetical protein
VSGKPGAFIYLFIFMAVLGVVLAIGSRALNSAIGLLGIGFIIIGSIVALWRSWKERGNPQASTFPSQVSVLPRKWQKWILGEDEDKASK